MSTVIQTRIDTAVKNEAEAIFKRMGMSLSDGIRIFIHQVITERALPFKPVAGNEPSEELKKILAEAEEDIKAGRLSKPYTDVDEMMRDLMKD